MPISSVWKVDLSKVGRSLFEESDGHPPPRSPRALAESAPPFKTEVGQKVAGREK